MLAVLIPGVAVMYVWIQRTLQKHCSWRAALLDSSSLGPSCYMWETILTWFLIAQVSGYLQIYRIWKYWGCKYKMNVIILNDPSALKQLCLSSAASAVTVLVLMKNCFKKPRTIPPTKGVLLAHYWNFRYLSNAAWTWKRSCFMYLILYAYIQNMCQNFKNDWSTVRLLNWHRCL